MSRVGLLNMMSIGFLALRVLALWGLRAVLRRPLGMRVCRRCGGWSVRIRGTVLVGAVGREVVLDGWAN
jgi:hypothetical protein